MKKFEKVGVNVVWIDDAQMKSLNQRFRSNSAVSNVISFSINEVMDGRFHLGEIVINLDEARREAAKLHLSLRNEILRLYTHGLRNLLNESRLKKELQKS